MKVSIVIPTYNCAPLLRTTLQSIRLCGWKDLEVIIRDGASLDATVSQLSEFVDLPITVFSEVDGGQYDAINKGMASATGEILCWINAGDFFLPGAVGNVVDAFSVCPEMKWITGRPCVAEAEKLRLIVEAILLVSDFEIKLGLCKGGFAGHLQQEGMFWRAELWEEAGPLDLTYRLAGDFELWTRFARVTPLYRTRIPLAAFSYHETNRSITGSSKYREEVADAIARLPGGLRLLHRILTWVPFFWRVCRRLPILREIFTLVFYFLRILPIKVITFSRRGSRFETVCKTRSAWVG
jgi:glycosyltransferase involved in cell wall biosynthesis